MCEEQKDGYLKMDENKGHNSNQSFLLMKCVSPYTLINIGRIRKKSLLLQSLLGWSHVGAEELPGKSPLAETHDKEMHKEMQSSSNGFLPIEILPCNAFSPLIHLISPQL